MSSDTFEEDGYCILDLTDPEPVRHAHQRLLEAARVFLNQSPLTLEGCHEFLGDGAEPHASLQFHLTKLVRAEGLHLAIVRENSGLLEEFLGRDIDVEIAPYLRVVRPLRSEDNIGLHRDTVYGGSPFELSFFIPFVDLDEGAALQVEPGSHLKGADAIPFSRTENPAVAKGTPKHQMGYPYAPQVLDVRYSPKTIPVPLRMGQAMVFSLALLHGSILNTSTRTRWSCDARIVNPFSPVKRTKTEAFMPLSRSPVTKAAERYLRASGSGSPASGGP